MKKFLVKFLIFSLPLTLLTSVYLVCDPFKVLYDYDTYYPARGPMLISVNRDYASMEHYKKLNRQEEYESFIFGSSRSLNYRTSTWAKFAPIVSAFHFDASDETLYGIEKKISFLDKKNAKINNALIILDPQAIKRVSNDTKVSYFVKHPELSGQDRLAFQLLFFKVFWDKTFLMAFIDLKLSGKVKPYMKLAKLVDDKIMSYNAITNELLAIGFEEAIKSNEDSFYNARKDIFYERPVADTVSPPVIGGAQLKMLQTIKRVLVKKNTAYKIIISPLYDQVQLHRDDLHHLNSIFGSNNVYDFSGKNFITNNQRSYYENSHYRMGVADTILSIIYNNKRLNP